MELLPVYKELYVKREDGKFAPSSETLYTRNREIDGYSYYSTLVAVLDYNSMEQVERIWRVLATVDGDLEIGVEFGLKHISEREKEVMALAVEHAREEAEANARAAGCTLGDVAHIEVHVDYSVAARHALDYDSDGDIPLFKPKLKNVSRSVDIEWFLV